MKKQLLFFLTIILSSYGYAQISFEKGYYISNSDQKIDCLIRNLDWNHNPTEFVYKLSENEETQKGTINTVKEFGIYQVSKYVRETVNMDKSSDDIGKLSQDKNPIFIKEKVFLKALVEGAASLYEYTDGNISRYFYTVGNSNIEQLVFKNYLTPEGQIGQNNRFRQQLWNDLKCSTFSLKKFESVVYRSNDLVRLFVEYNECNNQGYINFEEKQKRVLFNLNLRPGFNSSTLSIQNSASKKRNTDFDNEFGFRFGIEAEIILPFNKNKWAIIIEPTYQYYKSEKELASENARADYTSIELPIGARHYFFINENSKVFINASLVFDFSSNSGIYFDHSRDLDIKSVNNFAFGVGYKFNDKYSLELRYFTNRDILGDYTVWKSEYKTFSVILGYTLF